MNKLSPKRQDLMVKYLSDISKGFLIAMLAGTATGKLEGPYIVLYLLGAVLTFAAAYFLEDSADNA